MNKRFYIDQDLIRTDASQWEAYNSEVNTVVIAGPGSGKTRVLTLKAIKLLQSDIHAPSGLACISYSRETVRELKKRLKEYGYKSNKYDFIGTMHGFCLIHILQPFAHIFRQYKVPIPMKIASLDLIEQIYNSVLYDLNIDSSNLSLMALNRQRSLSYVGISDVEIQVDLFEIQAAELFESKLEMSGCVDFISIINIATQMIREQNYIRKTLEAKFPWFLIDEYQDLGKALHEMVLELQAQTEIKIFAVGDMNQSIYGFNGAYPDFLQELNSKDNFKSIPLTSNYRSNQGIIEGSIDILTSEPPRPLYSAKKRVNEEAEFTFILCKAEMQPQYDVVANKIIPKLKAKGISYSEIGILVASSNDVVQMATTLKDNDIPFYIVKWDFTNSDIVFWLQECAQWCLNSNLQSFDELFRYWQLQLKVHNDKRAFWEIFRQRVFFHGVLIESKSKSTVFEWLEFVLLELDLKELLKNSERYPDENDNLNALLNETLMKNLKDVPLKRFAFLGEPENEITVTTRHSAKGLEFEAVIMLGMEEERFPYTYKVEEGSRQMKEAHRLCYVGVSRAKRECFLICSKKHTIPTKRGPWIKDFQPSRFWHLLYSRFGNAENLFLEENY